MNDMRKLMEAVKNLDESVYADPAKQEEFDDMVSTLIHFISTEDADINAVAAYVKQRIESEEGYQWFNGEYGRHKNTSLDEVALRRDDEDWDDYSDERTEPDQEMKDAPYYVEWNAQSWEWYGDDDPSTGKGRYKPKGDGGRVVAINVPTFAQAQKIADKLDSNYEDGSFEDKNVYGTQGEDGYVLDYHGANIGSMAKMDEFTQRELKHVHPNFAPKDFGG